MVRVLAGCERSGVVREAFRSNGHDAWSVDLVSSDDGSKYHIQADILSVLDNDWDLAIFHPPCTFLAVSGARWFASRSQQQEDAIRFAERLWNCSISKIALENPVSVLSTRSGLGKPTQIIHPWQYGHGETKTTCLWLKGLTPLIPTRIVSERNPRIHRESPGIRNGLTRQQRRSTTYQGIADAMAAQWGGHNG